MLEWLDSQLMCESGSNGVDSMRGSFVLSVDVDGWSSLLRFYSVKHDPVAADSQVDIGRGIMRLLKLFRRKDTSATFFVCGEMARKHKRELKAICEEGHEIACHGLTHDKEECLLPFKEQKMRIKEASRILQVETGVKPRGFRAPCLRANGETVKALEELEYVYDSSVLPSLVPGYYGYLTTFSTPYHPSVSSLVRKGNSRILELPVSVNPVFRVPLSASWMRNLGSQWVKMGIKWNFRLGNPVVFYVHPRDVMDLPRVGDVPWHVYRNVGEKSIDMLDEVIDCAKRHGEIIRAIELAENSR